MIHAQKWNKQTIIIISTKWKCAHSLKHVKILDSAWQKHFGTFWIGDKSDSAQKLLLVLWFERCRKRMTSATTSQSKGSNVLVPSSRRLVRGPLFLRQRTLSSEPPFSYSKPRVKPPGNVASRRNSGLRSLSGRWAAATVKGSFLDFIYLAQPAEA